MADITARRTVRRTAPAVGAVRGDMRAHSTSAAVHRLLRNEIVTLVRKPGDAILERSLAEEYGVSRTPVREVLRQLAEEGLVAVYPNAGTFVARIPAGDLEEAIVIRNALEEASAKLAAERADEAARMRIDAALQATAQAARLGDREAFHVADESFHAEISGASGFPGIWRVAQQVKVQLDRYRRLTLPEEGRMLRIVEEHAAIFEAIGRADPTAAASAMTLHLGKLLADLDAVIARQPDFFHTADERRAAGRLCMLEQRS